MSWLGRSYLLFALSWWCLGSGNANEAVPRYAKADRILVVKSERKLHLYKDGEMLRSFDIALGLVPEGPKRRAGDFRTPEGQYHLEEKNSASDYFLALKVSYPNEQDSARARAAGVNPGGQIMIHGQPNEPGESVLRSLGLDWTDGCIAVSDSDMMDIWLMTDEGIPIEIRP